MALRVAINGFGRIGRLVLRAIVESKRDDIVVVGVTIWVPSRPTRICCAMTACMDVFRARSRSTAIT